MILTSEKKEIILCALAQLLMKNTKEAELIQEIYDQIEKEIEVIDL